MDVGQYKSGALLAPTLVANFPLSGLLNGFTTLDSRKALILVADAGKGWVWRLNVWTGAKTVVISDPLTQIADATKKPIGVNGLKLHDGFLYWSNINQELLAKTPITKDGLPTGASSMVTHYATPDDILFLFAFHEFDGVLAAGNDTIRVSDGTEVRVLSDSDLLKGSTAVAVGRRLGRNGKFFVSTSGGIAQYADGDITVPGKVVSVEFI